MPRLDTVWVVLLAMPSVAIASTGAAQNHQEIRTDQLVVDVDWNERDARELADFARLASALKDAGQDRMARRYRDVNARVQEAITREIQQAQVKSAQAAQDARLSMDASVSGDTQTMFGAPDEVRDRDNTLARYEEMVRIGTMTTALQNPIERGDRAAMKRNLQLTETFLGLLRRDFAAAQAEAAEARAELREER